MRNTNLALYAPLMYGLPYSSNIFTQSSSGESKKRGWTPKPNSNFSSDEEGTAERTFGDIGDREKGGGRTERGEFSFASGSPSLSSNGYYGRNNTLAGLGQFGKTLGINAGVVGAGLLAAGAPTGVAINAALASAMNPASFAGAFGQLGATALGVDTHSKAQQMAGGIVSTLGGLIAGPVGGILGAIAGPFVGDALADVTNSRSFEKSRDIAESLAGGYSAGRTLGTGFAKEMEANAKYGDILGAGSLAMNAAAMAAQRSGVFSNPRSNFDKVNGPQAMARAAMEEQGVAGGWETQARINAAMNPAAVEAAKVGLDVARASGITTSVQTPGTASVRDSLNDLSRSQAALSNPAVAASIGAAQKATVAANIGQDSFSQPSMSTSQSTTGGSTSSDSRGGGINNVAKGGSNKNSGGDWGGNWGGMMQAGIDAAIGALGGGGMLGGDNDGFGGGGRGSSGGGGNSSGNGGGKGTGNSSSGKGGSHKN